MVAGCSSGGGTPVEGAAGGSSSTTEATSPPAPAEPVAPEETQEATPDSSPEAAPLDHGSALEAGLAGTTAIKCVYNFDDEELDGQRMLTTTGWSTPVADIYLDGEAIYWEIPQEDNRISHVLGAGISTYAWKTPGDHLHI
jgi:hypothetical protein